MNRKFKQHKPHLFDIGIFRDIIDVFTVIFDQYYVSCWIYSYKKP